MGSQLLQLTRGVNQIDDVRTVLLTLDVIMQSSYSVGLYIGTIVKSASGRNVGLLTKVV
jgi:hypothetical protein